MKKIDDFINDYASAVYAFDIPKIASYYPEAFTFSTPLDLWHLKNDEVFWKNLQKSFDAAKKVGAAKLKLLNYEIINLPSNHYIANIEWGLMDEAETILARFDISYGIKSIQEEWKFIFVIDHNQNERMSQLFPDVKVNYTPPTQ